MVQPGVCVLTSETQKPSLGCVVSVVFVTAMLNKSKKFPVNFPQRKTVFSPGHVQLVNVPTNLVFGAWLRYAAFKFDWATHIVKMDQDMFPHFHNEDFLPNLARANLKVPQFFGNRIKSHGCNCPLENVRNDQCKHPDTICAMYGGWYGMSLGLAKQIFTDGSEADRHPADFFSGEDRAMGAFVSNFVKKSKAYVEEVHMGNQQR
eukprot:TRINITY_DN20915_c0_g1_i2.p1 TRINITY_DN20915_c0_g1~~TRINITY_DN20915_c0_g1_i2.p1  ORF type:complete len:205 (-),score=25.00 TRINITY_DN20915_c0_g1_i2:6-620(-)